MKNYKELLERELSDNIKYVPLIKIFINNKDNLEITTIFYRYQLIFDNNNNIKIDMKVKFSFLLVLLIIFTLYFALLPIILLIAIWGIIERKKIIGAIKEFDEKISVE